MSPELQPAKDTQGSDNNRTVPEWGLNTGPVEGTRPVGCRALEESFMGKWSGPHRLRSFLGQVGGI